MTTIISIEKNDAGFHDVENRSHCYIPEGFLFVPPELEALINNGRCELLIEGGSLVGAAPEDSPEEKVSGNPEEEV